MARLVSKTVFLDLSSVTYYENPTYSIYQAPPSKVDTPHSCIEIDDDQQQEDQVEKNRQALLPSYQAYPTIVPGDECVDLHDEQQQQQGDGWRIQEPDMYYYGVDSDTKDQSRDGTKDIEDGVFDFRKVNKYRFSLSEFNTPGYYSIVWHVLVPASCVIGGSDLKGRVLVKDNKGGRIEWLGKWSQDRLQEQDQQSRVVRLRLNRQVWLDQGFHCKAEIQLTLKVSDAVEGDTNTTSNVNNEIADEGINQGLDKSIVDAPEPGSVFLLELQPFDSKDSVPSSSTHTMDIPMVFESAVTKEKATILATDISGDLKRLVAVSQLGKEMILNQWNLERREDGSHTGNRIATTAFAVGDFSKDGTPVRKFGTKMKSLVRSNACVATSFDGEFVAVSESSHRYSVRGNDRLDTSSEFPVRLFQRTSPSKQKKAQDRSGAKISEKGIANGQSRVLGFHELKYDAALLLSTYTGFVKFQSRFPKNGQLSAQSHEPVLVTFDGRCIDVYQVQPKVRLIHSIVLTPLVGRGKLQVETCRFFMSTLQESLFVCNIGDCEEATIWNWRTGRCVGRCPSGDKVMLSNNEEVLISIYREHMRAYSVANGMLLSSTQAPFSTSEYRQVCQEEAERITILTEYRGGTFLRKVNINNTRDTHDIDVKFPLEYTPLHVVPNQATSDFVETTITENDGQLMLMNIQTDMAEVDNGRANDTGNDYIFHDDSNFRDYEIIKEYSTSRLHLVATNTFPGKEASKTVMMEIPFNQWEDFRFLRHQRRLLIKRSEMFELWELPRLSDTECSLLAVGHMDSYDEICLHENSPNRYNGPGKNRCDTSPDNFLRLQDTFGVTGFIHLFSYGFENFPTMYKISIVKLILRHINNDPGPDKEYPLNSKDKARTSVMWTIILKCLGLRNNSLLRAVLESRCQTYWIPKESDFSANADIGMISYLISEFKIPVARLLIDYCLARAHSTDPVFFDLLMISVPHILPSHPDIALEISRRGAYIPVQKRHSLLSHAVINNKRWTGKFWETKKTNLFEVIDENPTFHLLNRLPMLEGRKRSQSDMILADTQEDITKNRDIKSNLFAVPVSLAWSIQSHESSGNQQPAAWILVFRMLKHFVYPLDTVYVQSVYSGFDVCDNPAVEALMNYKWNRFARYFWGIRLFFQTAYEFLVLAVTFVQIYSGGESSPVNLQAGYVSTIILGYMLLHLEFQQVRAGYHEYFSSPYNYVDVSVYTIPMIASLVLLVHPENTDALRALSFAIVLIYLHFIFELRVFKNVHKVVTIVVNILLAIPAFFVILAIFILSFAHSINHLTEVNYRSTDCPPNDDGSVPTCQTLRDEFPFSYLQSVSATYFFMTGDYGPVATSLTGGHWTSQLMVGFFFFLTAVLMMNVVIALMNGVYSDAVTQGEFIWLKNRLDLIAGAENLTFYLPYFRDHFDYFPKFIYYTATDKQVKDYREKYELDKKPLQFDFSTTLVEETTDEVQTSSMIQVASTAATSAATNSAETKELIVRLRTELEDMKTQFRIEKQEMEARMEMQEEKKREREEEKERKFKQEQDERDRKNRELLELRDQRVEEMFRLLMMGNQVSSSSSSSSSGAPFKTEQQHSPSSKEE